MGVYAGVLHHYTRSRRHTCNISIDDRILPVHCCASHEEVCRAEREPFREQYRRAVVNIGCRMRTMSGPYFVDEDMIDERIRRFSQIRERLTILRESNI